MPQLKQTLSIFVKWPIKWLMPLMVLSLMIIWNDHLTAKTITTKPSSLCMAIKQVAHQADADVNHGHDWSHMIADPVQIPLTVDMADRLGMDLGDGVELNAPIGFISVYKDGRILYDDKDISGTIKDECAIEKVAIKPEKETK